MTYIPADKLIAEIERYIESAKKAHTPITESNFSHLLSFVKFLQQEQSEDIVVTAKAFLDALSKTPYNNKPITDAQTIVRQLLLFFENPKEYNPDAILERPEVDLDSALTGFMGRYAYENSGEYPSAIDIAKHFYELGLKARKV